jgi:hypothetical protein
MMFWFFYYYSIPLEMQLKGQSNRSSRNGANAVSFKCTKDKMFAIVMGIVLFLCVVAQLATWVMS